MPFIRFAQASYTRVLSSTAIPAQTRQLSIREIGGGLQVVLHRTERSWVRGSFGVFGGQIKDDTQGPETGLTAIEVGIGYEVAIGPKARCFFDLKYNRAHANRPATFSDYSNRQLVFGFVL